jgi:coatomer protein complex subunit gamma
MQPLGGSELPTSTSVHTLNLAGFVAQPGKPAHVLARARMTYAAGEGVTMELGVRADNDAAAQLVLGAIA